MIDWPDQNTFANERRVLINTSLNPEQPALTALGFTDPLCSSSGWDLLPPPPELRCPQPTDKVSNAHARTQEQRSETHKKGFSPMTFLRRSNARGQINQHLPTTLLLNDLVKIRNSCMKCFKT